MRGIMTMGLPLRRRTRPEHLTLALEPRTGVG
jgi:hypothetical protein